MKFTCPKCGKQLEMSSAALSAADYRTVCPQCLTPLQIVGQYAYVPAADGTLDLAPSRTDHPTTPPPFPDAPAPTSAAPPEVTMPSASPDTDPLLPDVIAYLQECVSITPMMLADHFHIPLERAQSIVGQLERAGIVGPYNHGGPRTILIPHHPMSPRASILRQDVPSAGAQKSGQPNGEPSSPWQPVPEGQQPQPQGCGGSMSCGGCLLWAIIATFVVEILRHLF